MTSVPVEQPARRRRRREESEREILEAAERLLRERPFRDLTVDDLMASAGQSRTAFYRHFSDRQELLIGVYKQHGPLLRAIAEAANHDQEIEEAYGRLVQVFVDATVERMERDQAAGRVALPHLRDVATALIWMSERYLTF